MITVLRAGPLTTVQDLGRPGFAHLGVPRSGALDQAALHAANALVGNDRSAAGLETTLMGCRLRFEAAAVIAVTGALCTVKINGVPFAEGDRSDPTSARAPDRGALAGSRGVAFGPLEIPAGAVVEIGRAVEGVRSYLAVAGGIAVDPVLGSRSTDTLSGLGPQRLTNGQVLPVGAVNRAATDRRRPLLDPTPELGGASKAPGSDNFGALSTAGSSVEPPKPTPELGGPSRAPGPDNFRELSAGGSSIGSPNPTPELGGASKAAGSDKSREVSTRSSAAEIVLGVWVGPRADWVDVAGLFVDAYGISPVSNRVACRLAGRSLRRTQAGELPPEGLVLGAIQVPPDGQPLIFLADHPTTGGYPVVGVVDDVTALAQARPRTSVRFRELD